MLYYNRIDVSEGIDVNETCIIQRMQYLPLLQGSDKII